MAVTITLKREQVSFWALRFKGFLAPSRLTAVATRRWHTLLLRYFRANVATRHATANRLGATPTAHWSNPASYIHLHEEGGKQSSISITRPGIERAVRDVTIRPSKARALTIPLKALAYGKRPGELSQTSGQKLFRPKKSRLLGIKRADGSFEPLYVLAGSVFQKRDPSLLPPQSVVIDAIRDALEIELSALALEAKEGLNT